MFKFRRRRDGIELKTAAEIEQMKEAGRISALALRRVKEIVQPGVSTLELDDFVESLIRAEGAKPAFKGYGGFPGSICASVNNRVVHGIPSSKLVLKEGDIVSIDTGAVIGGWVGDNAATYAVGEVSPEAQRLIKTCEEAMWAGIDAAIAGNRLGDIGHAVQKAAEEKGFGVVRDYVGHGVGHKMHEKPQVPNYGKPGRGVKLESGMVLAIEPMITQGTYQVHTVSDGWGVDTNDGLLAAHSERTIAVTEGGPLVLTREEHK